MKKDRIVFGCQNCGYQSAKWLGKCPDCGQWNTFVEERISTEKQKDRASGATPCRITDVEVYSDERFSTGISELDRVLGGGVVAGSVVLVGGDPGIGKSTLMLQAVNGISSNRGPVLYVSGEESPQQIKMRSLRLGIDTSEILILPEVSLEAILESVKEIKANAIVVDSIQTLFTSEIPSAPGSIGQVREVAGRLMVFAKKSGIPVFIIGHVTKDGSIAGPRVLEHIVDTVLYFEGEKGYSFRILRAVKNRFGSTNEIGIFEMKESGLIEVENPSEIFLSERPIGATGSVVISSMEGTRPLLVELQALVSPINFGVPRRTAIGVDYNRVSLLLAVLEKRVGMPFQNNDVYVNVVGGIRIDEPAVDLGIITAVASSLREIPVDPKTVVFGEVGLTGEVRAIGQAEPRIKEASKLGFKRVIIPSGNARKLAADVPIEITGIETVEEGLEVLLK